MELRYIEDRITIDPFICNREACCIKGTSIKVSVMLDNISEGVGEKINK